MARWFDLPLEIRQRVYAAARFRYASERLDQHIGSMVRCECQNLKALDFQLANDKLMRIYKTCNEDAVCLVYGPHITVSLHVQQTKVLLDLHTPMKLWSENHVQNVPRMTMPRRHACNGHVWPSASPWLVAQTLVQTQVATVKRHCLCPAFCPA